MLGSKTKGLFVDFSDYALLVARTNSLAAPLTIEALAEYPVPESEEAAEELADTLREEAGLKSASYLVSRVGCYPTQRFIRRFTMDLAAKNKNPDYFQDILSSQFRIEPSENTTAILTAADGADFDVETGTDKELMMCGAPTQQLAKLQNQVLACSLYPQSLEIGTVATLGGLAHYCRHKKIHAPTLVLEITPANSNVFIFRDGMLDVSRPIPYGVDGMYPAIQQELGLKDENSARKLFYSNTFDFTEMGPKLLKKMLKELQASTGFYEVQTGQTIGQIFLTLLPKNLNWVGEVLGNALGVEVLQPDFGSWLRAMKIQTSDTVDVTNLESRWFGLFSLMGTFQAQEAESEDSAETQTKEGSSA
jgi:hypothetical protein